VFTVFIGCCFSFLRHEPTHGNRWTTIDIGRMFTPPQGFMSTAHVNTLIPLKVPRAFPVPGPP
jgi:hypothetical protein